MIKNLNLPLTKQEIKTLKAGDVLNLSGIVYTARDMAHFRLCECIKNNTPLPLDIKDIAIYYAGPTPTLAGEVIGSCGPTTSSRMDDYAPMLMDNGVNCMIGKGKRSPDVMESMKKNTAVYLSVVGGAAALIKSCVIKNEEVAYEDLGCEAIHKLTIKNLQAVVSVDCYGNTILK